MRPAVPPTELPLPRVWGGGLRCCRSPALGLGSAPCTAQTRQPRWWDGSPRPAVLTPGEPRVFIHLPGCPTASGSL